MFKMRDKKSKLNNKFDHIDLTWGTNLFDIALSNLTPTQLWKYANEHSTETRDILYYLWSSDDLTYAYEAYWGMLHNLNEEELNKLNLNSEFGISKEEIPDNFKPDTKLKDIYPNNDTWCPHNNFKIG